MSKQERLPFLRLARNNPPTLNIEKSSTNSSILGANDQQNLIGANKKYQNIIKKYRKKIFHSNIIPSLSNHAKTITNSNRNLLTMNNNILKQNSYVFLSIKDIRIHICEENR